MAAQMKIENITRSASCRVNGSPFLAELFATENPVDKKSKEAGKKVQCLCSPTNHPGSFRCRLHRAAAAIKSSFTSSGNSSYCKKGLATRKFTQEGSPQGGQPRLSRFSAEVAGLQKDELQM